MKVENILVLSRCLGHHKNTNILSFAAICKAGGQWIKHCLFYTICDQQSNLRYFLFFTRLKKRIKKSIFLSFFEKVLLSLAFFCVLQLIKSGKNPKFPYVSRHRDFLKAEKSEF